MLKNTQARVRPFPGATVKQLHHYVTPTLIDDAPDTVIIQDGCNDVSNKNSNSKDIAKATGILGNICRNHDLHVEKTFIWIIKLSDLNLLLKLICQENVSIFISNDYIFTEDLLKDGLISYKKTDR